MKQLQVIDRIALLHTIDKKVLFVRKRGNSYFSLPGGLRQPGEKGQETLAREMRKQLHVDLFPLSVRLIQTFVGSEYDGTVETVSCWEGDYFGKPIFSYEVDEIARFDSNDGHRTDDMGRIVLQWAKEQDLID